MRPMRGILLMSILAFVGVDRVKLFDSRLWHGGDGRSRARSPSHDGAESRRRLLRDKRIASSSLRAVHHGYLR